MSTPEPNAGDTYLENLRRAAPPGGLLDTVVAAVQAERASGSLVDCDYTCGWCGESHEARHVALLARGDS